MVVSLTAINTLWPDKYTVTLRLVPLKSVTTLEPSSKFFQPFPILGYALHKHFFDVMPLLYHTSMGHALRISL